MLDNSPFENMQKLDDELKNQIYANIQDTAVLKTDWFPISSALDSGAKGEASKTRMVFNLGGLFSFFGLVFMILGAVCQLLVVFKYGFNKAFLEEIAHGTVSSLGSIAFGYVFYSIRRRAIFDYASGTLTFIGPKTKSKPSKVPFRNIYAIQLLTTILPQKNGTDVHSYELNLVLNNFERISIFNSDFENNVRNDAKALSTLVNIPIWNAIEATRLFYYNNNSYVRDSLARNVWYKQQGIM